MTMGKIKQLFTSERGNVLVIVSLAFTGLLAMTGIVIDGGTLYMQQTHLQKTANAAVLSSAQELTSDPDVIEESVQSVINETLHYHDESDSFSNRSDKEELLNGKVGIELKKPVPLAFSKILGFESVNLTATAGARIGYMGRAAGAAPLGIDESIELEFGKEYTLKVDEQDVDTGNFGILALEGTGAKTYEDTLKYGADEEFKVGDIVNTQTGNIAGPTKRATDYLTSEVCDNPAAGSCLRTILIPVYKPYEHNQNQMKQIIITGFAYFYLTESMDENDKTIKGEFIKRTGPGYEHEGAQNRGAFSIRLTE